LTQVRAAIEAGTGILVGNRMLLEELHLTL